MPILDIGRPTPKPLAPERRPVGMFQSAGQTRRDFLRLSGAAAATALAACGPSQRSNDATATTADGKLALWPENVSVPEVNHPGYGYHFDYHEMGNTGPWPQILSETHQRQIEKFADIILPKTEDSPAASEVGIGDFFNDWTSAPYPAMSGTRKTVHEGMAWLDRQSQLMFDADWLDLSTEQATEIVQMMSELPMESGPLPAAAWMYKHLRELTIEAYFTTPAGEADLGYIGGEPITGDYPGPTGEALAHIKQVILDADLDWDDLPVGPPAAGDAQ